MQPTAGKRKCKCKRKRTRTPLHHGNRRRPRIWDKNFLKQLSVPGVVETKSH
jgi:hypothetical protein